MSFSLEMRVCHNESLANKINFMNNLVNNAQFIIPQLKEL